MIRKIFFMFFCLINLQTIMAQPVCHVSSYYNTSNNEPLHHVCGILQDKNGMIWITSWGGMFSFDGHKFTIHNDQITKSLGIAPGHSRGVEPCPTGDKWMLVEKPHDSFITDQFGTRWHMNANGYFFYQDEKGVEHIYNTDTPFHGYRGCFVDNQNNLWVLCYYAIHKIEFSRLRLSTVPGSGNQSVRCMHHFKDGSYWICLRRKSQILIYNSDGKLKGYLSKDGVIQPHETDFFAPIYSIYELNDGKLCLGTRGKGLYFLTPSVNNTYQVQAVGSASQNGSFVYDIDRDRQGRFWTASIYGGLHCITPEELTSSTPKIMEVPRYPYSDYPRAHSIAIKNDTLVLATSEGLIIADLSPSNIKDISFKCHKYNSNISSSLSSNLVDYVTFDSKGRLFVCTENGGINICTSNSLLEDHLRFQHFDEKNGLPNIALCLSEIGERYWVTSLYSISSIKKDNNNLQVARYGEDFFGEKYLFDEIPPMVIDDGKWILATAKGAMLFDPKEMEGKAYSPRIVPTLLDINGMEKIKYPDIPDVIELSPDQRSFSIEFSALDYSGTEDICYSYRLTDIDTTWVSLGTSNKISFINLVHGKHRLEICSTNSQGQWTGNSIFLTLDVKPRFIETPIALILLILLCSAFVSGVIYTILYIRNIKRKHNQMLAEYLSIIGKREKVNYLINKSVNESKSDDVFITKLTEYIKQNLSNSDLRTEMIADYMSVSLSTLTRNTKSLMGVTPGDFLFKARIRKAEILLIQQKSLSISDIAYNCGFNDPKYFSRCFKHETKLSPSEYRSRNNATLDLE